MELNAKQTKSSLSKGLRTLHTINLGCSKNLVDAERIAAEFRSAGIEPSDDVRSSDFVLINTCGFIEAAKEESIQTILEQLRERGSSQKVIVAGCLSQRYKDDLAIEIPEIDFMAGTYKPGEILQLIGEVKAAESCRITAPARIDLGGLRHHAYLKIAEGCNRTCSFCAIPGIRGKQKSRTIASIVDEAQVLQQAGVQELSLIAQDLTFFGREKGGPAETLEQLLHALVQHTDLHWIRLMYAYPAFLDDSMLSFMAAQPRICNYLDMPTQHASNSMLKRMRRGYTRESLSALVYRLRDRIPQLALRTTVLLGFPGETEQDQLELLDFLAEARFDRLGGFAYSPEEGTSAMQLTDAQVPNELAQERLAQVLDLQAGIAQDRNESLIGQTVEVILDEVAEESEIHFLARTQWDAPEVDNVIRILEGDGTPGTFRQARIVDASAHDLDAVLV